MTDYNSNSNRPQWNAAVSQDGAEVTRPEMNNLITGLDEDPFANGSSSRRGGKQHVPQYTKTETTITTNKNNNAVNNTEDWEQAGGQRSPSGNKRESHQEQQYNSKTERTGATRQEEEDTAVRNRRNNQQSGGRREENLIDTEEQQSSYQQQQSPSHQQRKQGGQQREEQESASSYQRNQGGQQQQRQGSQQEEQKSSYQRKQQGGQQQQRQGGQQQERESSYQRKQQGGQQQQQGQEGEEQQAAQQRHEMERLRSHVQHSVTDVVMWRDVVHSAAVFGVGLGLLLLIIWMPVTQMILYALLLAQTVALALVGLKYFMTEVSNAEYHHPLENVILSETTINPDAAHRLLDTVLRVVNAQLVQLKRLVLAEDIGTTLKFAATCWALTYFSTWFSGLTLLFVAWVSLFTLPKINTVCRQPIDRYVGTVRNQVGNLEQMIVQKVPQLRPLLTGRGIFAVSTQRQREEMNVNVNAGSPTRRGGPGGAGGQYAATSTTSTTTATGKEIFFAWAEPIRLYDTGNSYSSLEFVGKMSPPAKLPPTYDSLFHKCSDDVERMRYKQLGQTDMQVSCLGMGGVAFAGMYESFTEQQGIDAIDLALQKGINYFDTAPWYGQGQSEAFLGKALASVPRNTYYMATKVGRYELDMNKMFNFRAEHVLRGFEESLRLLQLEYVDLIQVHDFEFAPNLDIIVSETLPALQKLKDSGKARAIGVNSYEVDALKQLVEKSTVHVDTVFSFSRFGLYNNDLLKHVDYFRSKGIGIINGAPIGMGLLAERGPEQWHPARLVKNYMNVVEEVLQMGKTNNVNIADLAVKHATHAEEAVDITVVSMPKPELVETNIKAASDSFTDQERAFANKIQKTFNSKLQRTHWEPENVGPYKKFLGERTKK